MRTGLAGLERVRDGPWLTVLDEVCKRGSDGRPPCPSSMARRMVDIPIVCYAIDWEKVSFLEAGALMRAVNLK